MIGIEKLVMSSDSPLVKPAGKMSSPLGEDSTLLFRLKHRELSITPFRHITQDSILAIAFVSHLEFALFRRFPIFIACIIIVVLASSLTFVRNGFTLTRCNGELTGRSEGRGSFERLRCDSEASRSSGGGLLVAALDGRGKASKHSVLRDEEVDLSTRCMYVL
jgi:hypothetical protein